MTDSHPTDRSLAPWVLISGGFHQRGGMDRANYALCKAFLQQGRKIFLVAHEIDPELQADSLVEGTIVTRPLNSILLGEGALRRAGMIVAKRAVSRWPNARVVVNGGNCPWPDINWVHSVHAAWPRFDEGAPFWFQAKNAFSKKKATRDEQFALTCAKVVIANSQRTRRDLIALGVAPELIRVVYLGCDPVWIPASPEVKQLARKHFDLPSDAKVICFVGALGYDRNKGFDTLLTAFHQANLQDTYMLVAGGGRGWHRWGDQVRRSGVAARVRMLGFVEDIGTVFAASDLLVSPVRYEAFGLNALEAICRGIPAAVTASAGVAELYPGDLRRFLLEDPDDHGQLAELLLKWHANSESAKAEFDSLGNRLRKRSWSTMSEELVRAAEPVEQFAGCRAGT